MRALHYLYFVLILCLVYMIFLVSRLFSSSIKYTFLSHSESLGEAKTTDGNQHPSDPEAPPGRVGRLHAAQLYAPAAASDGSSRALSRPLPA